MRDLYKIVKGRISINVVLNKNTSECVSIFVVVVIVDDYRDFIGSGAIRK